MATVDELLEQLQVGEYFERSSAAHALGRADDPRVPPALIAALSDEDEWVIEAAAESLGMVGGTAAVAALMPLLDHAQYKVRTAAASALGNIGDTDALSVLQAHADDADSWVREAVGEAIRVLEKGGRPRAPVTSVMPAPPRAADASPAGGDAADIDALVDAAVAQVAAQERRLKDGSRFLRLALSAGRYQKVRIVTDEVSSSGEPRIRLLSIVGPAAHKSVMWAMRQNLRITRGAIGLLRLRKRDYLAMTETLVVRETDAATLAAAIERVGRRGDRLERLLTEGDKDTW